MFDYIADGEPPETSIDAAHRAMMADALERAMNSYAWLHCTEDPVALISQVTKPAKVQAWAKKRLAADNLKSGERNSLQWIVRLSETILR